LGIIVERVPNRIETPTAATSPPLLTTIFILPSNMAASGLAGSDAEFWLFGYG